MIRAALVLGLISLSLPGWLQRFTRETNSRAASAQGVKEYAAKRYGPSAADFAKANELHPTPRNAFDLGTAQVAAGKREEGSHTLSKVMEDPTLREAALYNRGNSALSSSAFEAAVRDYTDALRLDPRDLQAKRNLEIALRRNEEKKKKDQKQKDDQKQKGPKGPQPQGAGGQKPQNQGPNGPQPGPGAGQNGQQQAGGAKDQQKAQAEGILRAIQQQESEELSRMKQARAQGQKAGW